MSEDVCTTLKDEVSFPDPYVMPRVRIVNAAKGPGAIAGWRTKVYIDDVDVSACVNDVQIHAGINDAVSATLSVLVNEVDFEGGIVTEIPGGTRAALIGLGWTPPLEESQ